MITEARRTLISRYTIAEVWQDTSNGHHSLHSTGAYQPGEVISAFTAASIWATPSYLTVQISNDKHIMLAPQFLEYINHSCDPNAFFDTTSFQLVCLKPIFPGDQFTFFYPSAEWNMAQPFACRCGSANCIGEITGASQLPEALLYRYRFTDFIRSKLDAAQQQD